MLSEPLTESPCLVCGLGRLSWNKRCLGWCARDGWKWAVCREERRRLGQSESRGQSRPGGRSMHPSIYLRCNLYLRSYTFNITRTSARLQPNAEETAVGRKDAQTADIKGMVGHIKDFQIILRTENLSKLLPGIPLSSSNALSAARTYKHVWPEGRQQLLCRQVLQLVLQR